MQRNKSFFLLLSYLALSPLPTFARAQKPPEAPLLKREEMMVMNLNRGPKSARFYILTSLKVTRMMQKDIERAQNQVEQIDQTYANSMNKPDNLAMRSTVERLRIALKTAQQLEEQLDAAQSELKSDIQQRLLH